MPIKQSAIKALRQNKKRHLLNLRFKRNLKNSLKIARKAIAGTSGEVESIVRSAVKLLDKAAQKGIIKRNNAARKKSRLWQALKAKQSANKI